MIHDYLIIGAGASGLMLAAKLNIKEHNRTGIILEGTGRPGSKLLMSGGGHCNITHEGSIKDFVAAYGDSGRALRKCLYRHNNQDLMEWLEAGGIPVTVNDEGKVYPASMKSSDVLNFLTRQARVNGWEIATGIRVDGMTEIEVPCKAGKAVMHDDANGCDTAGDSVGRTCWAISASDTALSRSTSYAADRVVIACGGSTYPETGSDGSMFPILKRLGVNIEPLRSALAPLEIKDWPYAELSGISVQDVTVTAYGSGANTCKGKSARMTGDILFTHSGFSGPVILNISQFAEAGEMIRINYNKKLEELPRRLRAAMEDRSRGPSGDIRTNKLAGLLDSDSFTISRIDPRGMASRGGIRLSEIDTATMRLKGLGNTAEGAAGAECFAIGEALDAVGITGGYNLQLCYSTACAVADYFSRDFSEE